MLRSQDEASNAPGRIRESARPRLVEQDESAAERGTLNVFHGQDGGLLAACPPDDVYAFVINPLYQARTQRNVQLLATVLAVRDRPHDARAVCCA